jgi:hypothetical protein
LSDEAKRGPVEAGPDPSEGESNASAHRRAWAARSLNEGARAAVAEDARHFLHQSVS